jgi:hypothetical protein
MRPGFDFSDLRAWLGNAQQKTRHLAPKKLSSRRLAGGFIADLVALGKAITLCSFCEHKFAARRHGYSRKSLWPGQTWVTGPCDGCRNPLTRCTLFIKET